MRRLNKKTGLHEYTVKLDSVDVGIIRQLMVEKAAEQDNEMAYRLSLIYDKVCEE